MESIERLLKRRVRFECTPRGSGANTRHFDTVHTSEPMPPDYDYPDWAPPSLVEVLRRYGALNLFRPSKDIADGFRLFTIDECLQELLLFRQTLKQAEDYLQDDHRQDPDAETEWIEGLCPIAEIVESGDRFAIDTKNRRDDGECDVLFLDHELYYGGYLEEGEFEKVADSVTELIEKILTDPLRYLDATWGAFDPYDQWFPESITVLD